MVDERVTGNSGYLFSLIEWLNSTVPGSTLPTNASWEEFRSYLLDGAVLCSLLGELCPGFMILKRDSVSGLTNLEKFMVATDEIGLPRFVLDDLVQGRREPVLAWLWNFKELYDRNILGDDSRNNSTTLCQDSESCANDTNHGGRYNVEEMQEPCLDSNSPPGDCSVLSDVNIMKIASTTNFENVSMRALFDLIHTILDDCMGGKDGYLYNMASVVKKLVQFIEQRISSQAEKFKDQNRHYKRVMESYRSKFRVFESLARGSSNEFQVLASRIQQHKVDKSLLEEKRKLQEENILRLKEELHSKTTMNLALMKELEASKKSHEIHCMQLKEEAEGRNAELASKLEGLEYSLMQSRRKVEELETFKESKVKRWRKKEGLYKRSLDFQFRALKELRVASEFIKFEVLKTQQNYAKEFRCLGTKFKDLTDAAESYHSVLAENRKLYNEVQDLKGNIRVYCRVRPFLSGQCRKQTTIEYIGDKGELVVSNPLKQGKEGHRRFKFNKVFSPESSQEEVFLDTQPLIRSVLDGYNVCIFAYGQTGSGKTYTMSGPCLSSKQDWGVNYRALHDLFEISQKRKSSITYEVCVQMVEIYNEQVRDLLVSDGSQRRLGIWSTTQPNGLAVPEASMHHVTSTENVLELMEIGLVNRAVGATALNERSSRSHSVLTVHVRGIELKSGAILRGSLHLVDLAGSERVDRSEATGDRLREAQHINKSLSALGDVIFALAQKSSHVPYRNSKLTQVLQSSLGGQAKTLMFVQLNPDLDSFSETISTLKFAERVSGVELGAARVNSEGRDYVELMDQVATLRTALSHKDREIERLETLSTTIDDSVPYRTSLRHASSSPPKRSDGSFASDKDSGPVTEMDDGSHHHHSDAFKHSKSMVDLRPEKLKDDSDDKSSDVSVDTDTHSIPDISTESSKPLEVFKAPIMISTSRDSHGLTSKLPKASQNIPRVSRLSSLRSLNSKSSTSTPLSASRRLTSTFSSATRHPRDATKVSSTSRLKRI